MFFQGNSISTTKMISNTWYLITFFLLMTSLPSIAIATTKTSTTPSSNDISNIIETNQIPILMSAKDAAVSMNSMHFLKELVQMKDTVNEKYYGLYKNGDNHNTIIQFGYDDDSNGDYNNKENGNVEVDGNNNIISVVEYTGRLWFMKSKQNSNNGIQFQESVRIHNLSDCGKYSTIECLTKYKSKDKWVDCSRVICTFQSNDESQEGGSRLVMKMGSEILIQLPLFGIGGAVKKQILKTFQKAADSYFHKIGGRMS